MRDALAVLVEQRGQLIERTIAKSAPTAAESVISDVCDDAIEPGAEG
jgi:hypothetical protein